MIATILLLYIILIKYYKMDKEAMFTVTIIMTVIYSIILLSHSLASSSMDPKLAFILLVI